MSQEKPSESACHKSLTSLARYPRGYAWGINYLYNTHITKDETRQQHCVIHFVIAKLILYALMRVVVWRSGSGVGHINV